MSAFQPWTTSNFKPPRGTHRLEREKQQAKDRAEDDAAKKAAKVRDGFRCRWPEAHKCRGPLEGAHLKDKSLLGENVRSNIVPLCRWMHRKGPESIHGKQLRIEAETERGADGPLSFWRQDGRFDALGQATYECVAREVRPFQIEKD
jgi:hypothetical protein